MEAPEIRYTTTKDGIRIAYGLYRGVGHPILYVPTPGSLPLQVAHKVKGQADCFDAINAGRPGIKFDFRGTGLSDRSVGEITFEDQVADVEAVCNAVGRELDVVATAHGALLALTLAVRTPSPWRTMTLFGPQAVGYSTLAAELERIRNRLSPLEFRELLLRETYEIPANELPLLARQLDGIQSAAVIQAHRSAAQQADVSGLLNRISIPTLVVAWPRMQQLSAHVAAQITGARFVPIDSAVINGDRGELARREMNNFFGELGPEQPRDDSGDDRVLSARECEVVSLVAGGHGNAEIAARLSLSPKTVARHIANIYAKLGVHNRVEAANWAREHGVV